MTPELDVGTVGMEFYDNRSNSSPNVFGMFSSLSERIHFKFSDSKGENETLPLKSFTKRNTCKAALGLGLFLHAES